MPQKNLSSQECEECCCVDGQRNHIFYVGPDLYYVKRERKGGTHQDGGVYGIKAGYDRIKRFSFYWGIDGHYAFGTLTGHSATGNKIKSHFKDANIEGRFGYTLQQKCGWQAFFTPFVGGGYAWEINNFEHPSPLKIHTKIEYSYVCGGFLSGFNLNSNWILGLNFKVKYPIDPRNRVSNDPDEYDMSMKVKERLQYVAELPIYYRWNCNIGAAIVPFYEFRHYGGFLNFPFDFIETKLNIYGATLQFVYDL